jgi:hypothetical protein
MKRGAVTAAPLECGFGLWAAEFACNPFGGPLREAQPKRRRFMGFPGAIRVKELPPPPPQQPIEIFPIYIVDFVPGILPLRRERLACGAALSRPQGDAGRAQGI